MGNVFISYRRTDTQDVAGRIYDRLVERFGPTAIYMDVDSNPVGLDFRAIVREELGASDVMLVIIGKQWLTVTEEDGTRRLDNPKDLVRQEVETALARNIPVVPVLTQGSPLPRESDLPPSIAKLAFRHGLEVRSGEHFTADIDRLITALTPIVGLAPSPPAKTHEPSAAPSVQVTNSGTVHNQQIAGTITNNWSAPSLKRNVADSDSF